MDASIHLHYNKVCVLTADSGCMKASVYTYTPCVFCCKTYWGSGAAFLGCPVLYEGQMYEDRWPVRAPSSPGSAVTGCEPAVAMGDTMSLLCRCGKQLWDTTCQ